MTSHVHITYTILLHISLNLGEALLDDLYVIQRAAIQMARLLLREHGEEIEGTQMQNKVQCFS